MPRILKDYPYLHIPNLRYKRSIIPEHFPIGKTWKQSKRTHSMLSVPLPSYRKDILSSQAYGTALSSMAHK